MYGTSLVWRTATLVHICDEKVGRHQKGKGRGRFVCYDGILVAVLKGITKNLTINLVPAKFRN